MKVLAYATTAVMLAGSFAFAQQVKPAQPKPAQRPPSPAKPKLVSPLDTATPIAFKEFLVPSDRELKPSAKLLGLNGKRVRIEGYMAKMEEPIGGGFYLCPRPTFCDEEGAGTADIPPQAVRVLVRGAKGRPLKFVAQPLVVTGILELGSKTEADGQISQIRLVLDRPQDLPNLKPTTGKVKETAQRSAGPAAVKTVPALVSGK